MPTPSHPTLIRFDALGVLDASGAAHSPGSILIGRTNDPRSPWPVRVLAVGRGRDVPSHEASAHSVQVVSRPRGILIPGLVNAHTHLDLTHIGPRPHDPVQGFIPWIDVIRRERCQDPEAIASSVRQGVQLSLAAGVVAVGDICGAPRGGPNLTPWRTLAASLLVGVSYLEFFGIGATWERSAALVESALDAARPDPGAPVRLGLQPHAPNTVSTRLYRRAVDLGRHRGLPLATHLAETPEEREFVAHARGPQRQLLERLGVWDDSILDDVGHGRTPVEHLTPVLEHSPSPFLVAHVNDASDAAIETLARTGTRVAYCPRASAYFGAERSFGPHRYRDMLRAGITVALGTDSIVNLPAPCRAISILDEMRFLFARDATDPALLLCMGTTHGATALGLPPTAFAFTPGHDLAGLVCVDVIPAGQQPPPALDLNRLGHHLLGPGERCPELLLARESIG